MAPFGGRLNGSFAQEAVVRRRLGERVISDPLLPFPVAPVREESANKRPHLAPAEVFSDGPTRLTAKRPEPAHLQIRQQPVVPGLGRACLPSSSVGFTMSTAVAPTRDHGGGMLS